MDHAIPAPRVFTPPRGSTLGVAEIASRGWHEASRWVDLVVPPPSAAEPSLLSAAPALADPATALQLLRDQGARRFFSGAGDDDTCAIVRTRFAEHCSVVVAAANALTLPMPWERLDRESAVAVDPAIAWEPNRHQWLVRLAQ